MPVEFYYFPLDPASGGVWMTLKALGLAYEERVVDVFKGEHKTPEYSTVNFRQTLPGIKDGSLAMGESRAIAKYLCNAYGSQLNRESLYPKDPKEQAKVDMHLYIEEAMLDNLQKYVNLRAVLMEEGQGTKTENVGEVKKVLDVYEKFLTENKYVAGGNLTIADFFAYTALTLLDLTEYDDYEAYPKVRKWKQTIATLPYHDETCKHRMEKLKEMYDEKMGKTSVY